MSFYLSIERVLNKILAPADVVVARQSRLDSENQGHLLARLADNARLIGSHGACEAFFAFAREVMKGQADSEISDFMHFYAKHYHKSRSQWAQDIFVLYATKLKSGGSYLEIGGADGLTHSNTLALRDVLGWSGVLIEPDPEMFQLLKASRGHTDQVIHAAISPDGNIGESLLRRAGQLSALVGHEGRDSHSQTRAQQESTTKVSLLALTEIIRSRPRIDYFSLDVEGAELSILRSIQWNEITPPGLITVEHNYRPVEKEGLKQLLSQNGYVEYFSEHDWLRKGDLWMRHRDYLP
jgi:FkbM family methyltransferase